MKNLMMLVCLMLAACASTPKSAPPQPAPVAKPVVQAPAPQPRGLSQAEIDARQLAEQLQALKDKSVYFDFDKSLIKPEYRDTVIQQADFIKAHGDDAVTLEGNCDERGSNEYNLALGQRRADAVLKSLEQSGVSTSQVKTVSFGEEKPRLTCHEEKCWHENRRVDFVHQMNR